MATPRDKFMELRKSGVDAQTARKQAYGDITPVANTPVAGQAPAITPLPTETPAPVQSNQDILAQNQAKVQQEIQAGARPQVGQQLQDMPIQKPVDIPKQLSVQDQATIDRMTAEGRFGASTPETQPLPKTETALTDKGVQKAPATTTEVAPPPITIGDMYNNLVNRIDVTPEMKALPTYKIAQNRFNKANMLASMTPAELSSEMQQSRIVEGSPAWEDLKTMNPTLVNNVKALNTVNGVKPEIFTYVNNPDGSKVVKNNLQDAFVSDYEDNYSDIVQTLRDIYNPDSAQQARDAIYTPEVRQAEEKATAIEIQMNALSDTIANIDSDVEKEYEGTGASGSRIALEKEFRNEKLSNRYNSLLKNYTTYANKANNLITQNSDIYKSAQAQKTALQGALQNRQNFADSVALKQMDYAESERIRGQEGTTWQSANITRYNPATGANDSTPIFYRKKTNGAGFEAVDLAGNPIDANLLAGGITGGTTGGGTPGGGYATGTSEMRTDRNNNPIAFTVDIAKQAGLVEGVDYVVGDKFPGSSNLYTAKIIGDPIETSIRVIDKIGFKTKSGQNRWTYTDKLGLTNESWANMSPTDKVTAIKKMYQQEGGNGKAIGEAQAQTTATPFNPLQVREFEAYDGKTIPAQYKTPMEQDQFVRDYNKWVANKPGIKIETGDDVLKIKLDKPTGEQSDALAYGARMINASKAVTKFEDEFLKLPIEQQYYQSKVPDILASQNQKSLEREKQDFITAVLREESGAAISPSEFAAQDRIFFPQPGDGPDVVIAKRNARNFRVKAMLGTAGYDAQGNTPATYFTPEVIVASEPPTSTAPTGETPEQRIARLRNQNK